MHVVPENLLKSSLLAIENNRLCHLVANSNANSQKVRRQDGDTKKKVQKC